MKSRPPQTRPEPLLDRLRRHRGSALVVSVPILVVSLLLFFLAPPRAAPIGGILNSGRKAVPGGDRGGFQYAVIFDAGSSGSRVHVYCFDGRMELVEVGREIELFRQLKPGLSSYAKNPQEAAKSLIPLLKEAESVVPAELRSTTPVRVGATAGLRALGAETSEQILQEVKDLLENQSLLKVLPNSVTVLDGTQEGAYQWVTINYLLGKLGKSYSNTVGVVDLGGGSVQMAYAISEEDAANAPKVSDGEDSYVQKLFLKGINYHLYVHSYLHYGLLAARAEILKMRNDKSDCILKGYHDLYKYGGMEYNAFAPASGASFSKCHSDVKRALKRDQQTCTHIKCTFNDVWSGGGGDGQKNLFVASFFFDRAAEAGFINPNLPVAKVKPADFKAAAKAACSLDLESAKAMYSNVQEDNLPYLCMDLVYQYTLLVDGFGLDPDQKITLVKKVQYRDAFVEAAWPLGSAIEVASSL